MMQLCENGRPVAQFVSNVDLGAWLMAHPDTHDYEWLGRTAYLRFREPWQLMRLPVIEEGPER